MSFPHLAVIRDQFGVMTAFAVIQLGAARSPKPAFHCVGNWAVCGQSVFGRRAAYSRRSWPWPCGRPLSTPLRPFPSDSKAPESGRSRPCEGGPFAAMRCARRWKVEMPWC
jgi:hypothetical protein